MPASDLLTAREVAQRLHIGLRTVWRWTISGELPTPVRLGKAGRVVRWKAAEIDHFLQRLTPYAPSAVPSFRRADAAGACRAGKEH